MGAQCELEQLKRILAEMNQAGSFSQAVLTDGQGLPLARDPENGRQVGEQAAVAALIQQAIDRSGFAQPHDQDEFSLRLREGVRLVCRTFRVEEDWLLLVVRVPKGQAYRRNTNHAIRRIRQSWIRME